MGFVDLNLDAGRATLAGPLLVVLGVILGADIGTTVSRLFWTGQSVVPA